jgi:transcriptional regulator with XRE-family HTH domain
MTPRARHVKPFVHAVKDFFATLPAMNAWGQLVKAAREAEGLSQADLAERIEITPSVLSRIEAGKVFIEPHVYRRLCNVLRALSPKELLDSLGYEISVSDPERLSKPLVRALRAADKRDWPAAEQAIRGLSALRQIEEAMNK